MARRLPKKDVVIIGLGWTGSLLAHELTDAGLEVVAIERGPWRDTSTDFSPTQDPDELRYGVRLDLFLRPAQETFTLRHNTGQNALPIRWPGAFIVGNGVGGAGVHWNGHTWRFLESDFVLKSHLSQRYGAGAMPEDMQVEDWGITYNDLEPYYDKFEYISGTSGRAGNIKGQLQPGGNPFEGPRSRGYPLPPLKDTAPTALFAKTANEMGYHAFPRPAGNASEAYVNPLGIAMGPCTYCGFCERFGCGNYSKASPQANVLPVLMRKSNFSVRTESEVLHINKDASGTRATGVTFVDTSGQEWEQPADIVLVCAYGLHNVRMMLLSGIGTPYDPKTGEGTVGRNYAYQSAGAAGLLFEGKRFNPFVGAGSLGQCIDDFNGDNFDHTGLGFFGGASITTSNYHGRPIASSANRAPGAPAWGSAWKKQVSSTYQNSSAVAGQGSVYSYRDKYLDLDPVYKDRYGRPLLRMTFDWHENEKKMTRFIAQKCAEIGKAMGAKHVTPRSIPDHFNVVPYQSTHNTGGAIMGSDPKRSAVNRYLQSWDVHNVFVVGASAFPQNAGYNPTGTVGALALMAADAIRNEYLKNPGPLVQA
ncbi:GMC family oxidoreductase [Azorhizobium oxalatiphilum]|uniref:GMC family oxidoreductase n=1 Tax=Azorhizobium oxalatiphilum TaxID=980631 RepID=A0A917CBS5_9HYPH|nr:GMC family oxidoreductase [Azorhizobium oxalatiphilum]GGF77396.1 GMC family oxidoreductase [Azorhizobium oxalatiphilum]